LNQDPHRDGALLRDGAPLEKAAGAVILLHGRGGSAKDILSLAAEIYQPELTYLAPQAALHSWYPYSFLAPIEQNQPWLSSALRRVESVLELATQEGLPTNQIVIAGFSQGACLATEFVASHPKRYGGLIALTGGLIGPPGIDLKHTGSVDGMPAFLGSGDPDPHVPWHRVEESARVLDQMGAITTLRRYPGRDHTISAEELELANHLIQQVFRHKKIEPDRN
jgi:predicted esterase